MTTCASPDILTQIIDIGAGAVEYLLPVTMYELSGVDISGDTVTTCFVPTGSEPTGWAAPDKINFGTITVAAYLQLYPGQSNLINPALTPASLLHFVVVQDLIGAPSTAGNYDWWMRIIDTSETVPRLIGRIQLT